MGLLVVKPFMNNNVLEHNNLQAIGNTAQFSQQSRGLGQNSHVLTENIPLSTDLLLRMGHALLSTLFIARRGGLTSLRTERVVA
jgi:hypothetical protein